MKNLICSVGLLGFVGFGSVAQATTPLVQSGDEIFYRNEISKVTHVDQKGRVFISRESDAIDADKAYKMVSSCGVLQTGGTGKLVINGIFFNMTNIRAMQSLANPTDCRGTAVAEDASAQSLVHSFSADDVIIDSSLTTNYAGVAVGETGYCANTKLGTIKGQVAAIYKTNWLILENVEHTVQGLSVACRLADYFTSVRAIDVTDSRNSILLKDKNGNSLLRIPYASVISQGKLKYRLRLGKSDVLVDADQVLNMEQVKKMSKTNVPGFEQGKKVLFSSENGGIRRGLVVSADAQTKIVFVEVTERRDPEFGRILPKFMSSLAFE
ncbi:MAG: hypothetical protein OM95_09740 [Bdellovibrio sp. ArHS]|uniref:hypothetical protein n=1 Tax=Bdellovibrio sp. ArHS TaxID=1569284 RepID=UPI0005827F0A|nr:hypothetical protein [Bdellovibrio sp. ArHS]KHD88397.1 MAG: hypothetical protein OM95_09740 [Bdellovibrio sp. ArHS]